MINITDFNVAEYDRILSAGLSKGMGKRGGQVCIAAAICQVLNLPHGDDPGCVASVRLFEITLNDCPWSSPEARAKGLRCLGLAQLGSLGVVNDIAFTRALAFRTINQLLPTLIRDVLPRLETEAKACEEATDLKAARAAAWAAARAAEAVEAAAQAAEAAEAAGSARAARAAERAAARSAERAAERAAWAAGSAAWAAGSAGSAAWETDKYLLLSASIALEILREMKSPGVALL